MAATTKKTSPKQQVGLAELWRRDRDGAMAAGQPHQPWCRGHGWMLDAGIVDAFAPFTWHDGLGDDSFFHFAPFGADIAGQLLELLPADYLAKERQNDGPTIGRVLRAVVAHPDRLRAHGYLIGAGRCDERVTVEGVLFQADADYRLCPLGGPQLSVCDCERLYQYLREKYGVDDAEVMPHELERWVGYDLRRDGAASRTWYRAWWD
jgi:hypothetical protein